MVAVLDGSARFGRRRRGQGRNIWLAVLDSASGVRIKECQSDGEAKREVYAWIAKLRQSYPYGQFRAVFYEVARRREKVWDFSEK